MTRQHPSPAPERRQVSCSSATTTTSCWSTPHTRITATSPAATSNTVKPLTKQQNAKSPKNSAFTRRSAYPGRRLGPQRIRRRQGPLPLRRRHPHRSPTQHHPPRPERTRRLSLPRHHPDPRPDHSPPRPPPRPRPRRPPRRNHPLPRTRQSNLTLQDRHYIRPVHFARQSRRHSCTRYSHYRRSDAPQELVEFASSTRCSPWCCSTTVRFALPFSINGTPDVDEPEAQKIRRRMRQHDAKVTARQEEED